MTKKGKIIAGVTGGIIVLGGVAFGFRDQFLSDKSLYLKIEKENIEMVADKFDEIKDEDLLGMFFIEDSNKSITKTDIGLNISGKGVAGEIANFFDSLKISVKDEVIQKDEYKNKKITFNYKEDELIDFNIVNDGDSVGVASHKLYDKWVVTDMSIGEFIAELIKSDEGTGTTNTLSMAEIKSAFELSKTEKQDWSNALKYHLDKMGKTLNNVNFTRIDDDTFAYDDNNIVADSIKLELSEIETLGRLSQMLIKAKENGQIIDLFYNKVNAVKAKHGNKNLLTDHIPSKQETLKKVNEWIEKIDTRLLELNITDVSTLFDENDKYIPVEGIEENYYSMVIFYDDDYKILKRSLFIPTIETIFPDEADYEIVCIDNEFYSYKTPNKIVQDNVEVDGDVATHNISKSYSKISYSFEGFKLIKTPKWVENEKFLTIDIDSSNNNQKIISLQIPAIKSLKLFIDIAKEKIGRNEINVVTKIGLDTEKEKQYATITKNIVRKADIDKTDIYSNSININEETQEKVGMIADVIKGNTEELSNTIKEKTGMDLTQTLETVKEVPQKVINTYQTLRGLGIIK